MRSCSEVRFDLAGHAMGGLDSDEAAAVEAHVDSCAACARLLAEYRDHRELLSLTDAETQAAPPHLRERVLATVPARRRRLPQVLAAALAAVVLVAAGATGATLLDRTPPADAEVPLSAGVWADAAGSAALRQEPNGVRVVLRLDGARAADEGYYHLWLHRPDDVRVSAGTFVGGPDGRVEAELWCGGRLEDYDRLSITFRGGGQDEQTVIATRLGSVPAGG